MNALTLRTAARAQRWRGTASTSVVVRLQRTLLVHIHHAASPLVAASMGVPEECALLAHVFLFSPSLMLSFLSAILFYVISYLLFFFFILYLRLRTARPY